MFWNVSINWRHSKMDLPNFSVDQIRQVHLKEFPILKKYSQKCVRFT